MINAPLHYYTQHSNKTINWVGTDQQERQSEIKSNPVEFKKWIASGWDNNSVIEYVFNEHGFRTDSFDQSRRIAVFGSSQTVGVGLSQEQSWPSIFGKILNQPIWNLATGSGAIDTCYRMIKYYVEELNISAIVLAIPEDNKWELWDNKGSPRLVNGKIQPGIQEICDAWESHENNKIINREKNLEAIKYICYKKQLPFIAFDLGDANKYTPVEPIDWSRCMCHVGPRYHNAIANWIIEKLLPTISIP